MASAASVPRRAAHDSVARALAASGHPLELYPDIASNTYCPVARLEEFIGKEVTM